LSQAWASLGSTAPVYYKVLRTRAENPGLNSIQLAGQLDNADGKPVTADWVRQTLRRARDQLADLLLDELADSMDNPSPERLQEDLITLRLLPYCQQALKRRYPSG
jgi:hypothetical protein